MEQSDHELLTVLATDVERHFRQVVMQYQQRLYTFALRLTGNPLDAEDVVQEAFVNAYVALENYPTWRVQTLKLQPWLYRVTLNVFNHYVRGARLHLVSLNMPDETPELTLEDREDERPEALFEQRERRQEIETLVASLPVRYRVAVICYYFEELTYQEVANLLDQPVGTVKSTIHRGIRMLRTMLTTAEGGANQLWSQKTPNNKKA